ncbi:MAG: helix-turn-helix transcriptional regulator [Bacteroidales bacterium]|nr:helix-turn-helix transcriptional regulator [Bacteroidales bacterium]
MTIDSQAVAGQRLPTNNCIVRSKVREIEKESVSTCYSLKMVITGRESYQFKNQHYKIESDKYLLVEPGTQFRVVVNGEKNTEGLCLYFSPSFLRKLAMEASLSVFHFSRLFKTVFDRSPCHYLMEVRIKEACRLLRCTNLTVADIGLMAGFPEQSNFSRAFRQITGQNPLAFKNSKI